jgi:DNA-binding FadR family transcriptional regulator
MRKLLFFKDFCDGGWRHIIASRRAIETYWVHIAAALQQQSALRRFSVPLSRTGQNAHRCKTARQQLP